MSDGSPIVVFAFPVLGDFVRCHSLIGVLSERFPGRPIDVVTRQAVAEVGRYMVGVRQVIVDPVPKRTLDLSSRFALARRLRAEGYGQAFLISRAFKAAIVPFLAGIPVRTGWFGEARFVLVNDMRFGEWRRKRPVDKLAAIGLARGTADPAEWPAPRLAVPADEMAAFRTASGLGGDVVALAPVSTWPPKDWPKERFAEIARRAAASGADVVVVGAPRDRAVLDEVAAAAGARGRVCAASLTDAIHHIAAARVFLGNDSGLLHVAAALGVPTIGMFGVTAPGDWAPINPNFRAILAEPFGTSDRDLSAMPRITVDAVMTEMEKVNGEQ